MFFFWIVLEEFSFLFLAKLWHLMCTDYSCFQINSFLSIVRYSWRFCTIMSGIKRCFVISVQCTNCSQLVIHPDQRFNFFSDYSQTVSCPHCGVQDFHFTKPLNTFVSRDELTKVKPTPLPSSAVDPDSYWIRIQKLCGSGSTHVNIGYNKFKMCQI